MATLPEEEEPPLAPPLSPPLPAGEGLRERGDGVPFTLKSDTHRHARTHKRTHTTHTAMLLTLDGVKDFCRGCDDPDVTSCLITQVCVFPLVMRTPEHDPSPSPPAHVLSG